MKLPANKITKSELYNGIQIVIWDISGKRTNVSDPNVYRCIVHDQDRTSDLTIEERYSVEQMIEGAKRLIEEDYQKNAELTNSN